MNEIKFIFLLLAHDSKLSQPKDKVETSESSLKQLAPEIDEVPITVEQEASDNLKPENELSNLEKTPIAATRKSRLTPNTRESQSNTDIVPEIEKTPIQKSDNVTEVTEETLKINEGDYATAGKIPIAPTRKLRQSKTSKTPASQVKGKFSM